MGFSFLCPFNTFYLQGIWSLGTEGDWKMSLGVTPANIWCSSSLCQGWRDGQQLHARQHEPSALHKQKRWFALKSLVINSIDSVDCTPHSNWARVPPQASRSYPGCHNTITKLSLGLLTSLPSIRWRQGITSISQPSLNAWPSQMLNKSLVGGKKLLEWVEVPRSKSGSYHLVIDEYSSKPP